MPLNNEESIRSVGLLLDEMRETLLEERQRFKHLSRNLDRIINESLDEYEVLMRDYAYFSDGAGRGAAHAFAHAGRILRGKYDKFQ